MSELSDRELRDLEKLKTTDDYITEIQRVKQLVCYSKSADKKIGQILDCLTDALGEKYKMMIDISKSYRKKPNIFTRWLDKRHAKKELKEQLKAYNREQTSDKDEHDESVVQKEESSLIASSTLVEVLENTEVKRLTEGENEPPDDKKTE